MATKPGKHFSRLIEDLKEHAPEYNVFYAIFLSEMISKKVHSDREEIKFDQKGLQFRPHENYVYPPKDIHSFDYQDEIITFILNFMGLYGINSPLPRCYHEPVAIQNKIHGSGKVPLQNFLDMFNNRFYWLYYQAWKKYRYHLLLSENSDNKNTQRIFAFTGQGLEKFSDDSLFPKFKLMRLSGVLCNRVRSKSGLYVFLKDFFPKFEINIIEFVPTMVKLTELPLLGNRYEERAYRLGDNSVIGKSVLDYMGRIRIEIGPMSFEDYLEFTPPNKKSELLKRLVRLYISDELEFDIKYIIRSKSIKSASFKDSSLRLGSSLWLGVPKQEEVSVQFPYEKLVNVN